MKLESRKPKAERRPKSENGRNGLRQEFLFVLSGRRKTHFGNLDSSRFPISDLRFAGFTLIEFIAVLAIISILALTLVGVVIKRVDFAAYNAEQANLATFANALTLQALRNGQIPGETTWAAAAGNWLSLPASSITNNARNYNRAFVYDSSEFISGSVLQLPYTQTTGLVNGVSFSSTNNLRLMIVSSLSANLPVSSGPLVAGSFNDIWNTTLGNIPGTWSGWSGRGDDLLIQRLNLQPLFHRVILNAVDTNNFGSFTVQSGTNLSSLIYVTTNSDAWFLQDTVIGLYDTNNPNPALNPNLESKVVVQGDASYVFENWAWRGQLSGWGTNGPASPTSLPPSAAEAFSSLATRFTAYGTVDKSPQILASFYAFMMDYNSWSQEFFLTTDTNLLNALSQDAARIQSIIP